MSKLKIRQCPWCMKNPRAVQLTEKIWMVQCDRGDHNVTSPARKTETLAIKAWNKRREK